MIEKIRVLAAAGQLRRRLKTARLGVVGEHPDGFDSCHLDAPKLNEVFGVAVERIRWMRCLPARGRLKRLSCPEFVWNWTVTWTIWPNWNRGH